MGDKGGDPGGNTGKKAGPLIKETSPKGGPAAQLVEGLVNVFRRRPKPEGIIQSHSPKRDSRN